MDRMNAIEIKQKLKERALLLQQEEKEEKKLLGEYINGLRFLLANETYAIDTKYITEVINAPEITPVPCTPKFVLGIINVRGKILSVIDLNVFFGLPSDSISDTNTIIVLKHNDLKFGILTKRVLDSVEIELNALQKHVPNITDVLNNYMIGVSNDQDIVLDIKQLLENNDIIVNDEV